MPLGIIRTQHYVSIDEDRHKRTVMQLFVQDVVMQEFNHKLYQMTQATSGNSFRIVVKLVNSNGSNTTTTPGLYNIQLTILDTNEVFTADDASLFARKILPIEYINEPLKQYLFDAIVQYPCLLPVSYDSTSKKVDIMKMARVRDKELQLNTSLCSNQNRSNNVPIYTTEIIEQLTLKILAYLEEADITSLVLIKRLPKLNLLIKDNNVQNKEFVRADAKSFSHISSNSDILSNNFDEIANEFLVAKLNDLQYQILNFNSNTINKTKVQRTVFQSTLAKLKFQNYDKRLNIAYLHVLCELETLLEQQDKNNQLIQDEMAKFVNLVDNLDNIEVIEQIEATYKLVVQPTTQPPLMTGATNQHVTTVAATDLPCKDDDSLWGKYHVDAVKTPLLSTGTTADNHIDRNGYKTCKTICWYIACVLSLGILPLVKFIFFDKTVETTCGIIIIPQ